MVKSEVPEQDCSLSGHKTNTFLSGGGSGNSVSHNGAARGGDASGGFIAVPSSAIAAVGGKWSVAVILCLIGFRCNGCGPDVIVDDRGRWLRASLARLSELSGASVSQVRSALNAGVKAGVLESWQHRRGGIEDQCFSWRVLLDPAVWDVQRRKRSVANSGTGSDQHVANSGTGSDQHVADSGTGGVLDLARDRASSRKSLPLSEEVEEGGEEGVGSGRARAVRDVVGSVPLHESINDQPDASAADASGAPDVRPAERCQRHDGLGWVEERCRDCARAKETAKQWDAGEDERHAAAVRAKRRAVDECARCDEYGQIDLVDSVAKCDHVPVVVASTDAGDEGTGSGRVQSSRSGAVSGRREFVRPSQREAVTV